MRWDNTEANQSSYNTGDQSDDTNDAEDGKDALVFTRAVLIGTVFVGAIVLLSRHRCRCHHQRWSWGSSGTRHPNEVRLGC